MIKKIIKELLFPNFLKDQINKIKINQGIKLSQGINEKNLENIDELNFSIFSQFNEDAIIQFLIQNLNIKNKKFVELGVENYSEANTRFLLEKDNWDGLIVDSSKENIKYIKKQNYFWRHNIIALSSFINKENINDILKKNLYSGEVGLLSVDIDGNDLWVWKEINQISPIILVIEYNAKMGKEDSLSIKYDPNFQRESNGIEKLIYGASLKALTKISEHKGYSLVCTNKNGNNAFFVKNDHLNKKIFKRSVSDCFKMSHFREYLKSESNKEYRNDEILEFLFKNEKIQKI